MQPKLVSLTIPISRRWNEAEAAIRVALKRLCNVGPFLIGYNAADFHTLMCYDQFYTTELEAGLFILAHNPTTQCAALQSVDTAAHQKMR
jgi:hypothetical protein